MLPGSPSEPLSELEVLVVDCQATAAAPRGHLLEIGWARVRNTATATGACLIALPAGEQTPPAVARITGISELMLASAVDGCHAWRELSEQAATLAQQPAPTVIHFAPFEQPFLRTFGADSFPLDVVCTRDIARRLLPDLPRCSLRALAGYFGRAVGALRRSADHVEATAFVWRNWSGCSKRRAFRRGARFTTGSPHPLNRAAADDASGRCRSAGRPAQSQRPRFHRGTAVRRPHVREALTVASFDRLRVLTTELKRLSAAGAPVALRLGAGPALDAPRLAAALSLV